MWRPESAWGTGKPGLLLRVFLGLECHPLEALSLGDAGCEWALEHSRGLWHRGTGGFPHAKRPGPL